MKKQKRRPLARISFVLLFTFLVVYLENNITFFSNNDTPTVISSNSPLSVHLIDVGQGDSILIESDGSYMLIDAGDNHKGSIVVDYLNSLQVKELEYVIGTHPHSDHIGGLDEVINSFSVNKVIMPDVLHTTRTFEDLLDAIEASNLKITKAVVGNEYHLGLSSFIIIAPNSSEYSNLNDYSVGIKLTNGTHSFLLSGDAEDISEKEMLQNGIDLSADVLKLNHHGSAYSSHKEFINAVQPTYAVISAGTGNKYGHPHEETLQALRQRKIAVYRTDELGTIIFHSDGKTLTVK